MSTYPTCLDCRHWESMEYVYDDPEEPWDMGRCAKLHEPDGLGTCWYSPYIDVMSDELRDMSDCSDWEA